jgi:hypothetical protein
MRDMPKIKCWLCGKQVSSNDPMYPSAHYKCMKKLLEELEAIGIIKILSINGTQIKYKFKDNFEKELNKTLDNTRYHIITDDTVDDDIVTLQGVLKAVVNYLPKKTPQKKVYRCAEFVFNSLMTMKYDIPLPKNKKFGARTKEFLEEVYSADVTEEVLYQKVFGNRKIPKNVIAKENKKMLPSSKVNKELDRELDKETSKILGIIKEMAIDVEKKFGASKKWRNFRMDELLLQTVKEMILEHLQTATIKEITLDENDIQMLNNSINSLFTDVVEISTILAKKNKIPVDVVLARNLNNIIMNLVWNYVKMKYNFIQKHG